MIRKCLTILAVLPLLGTSVLFAESSTYNTPTYTTVNTAALDFSAEYTEGKVKVSWDTSALDLDSTETWKYWKVLKSQSNDNPLYPDISAFIVSEDKELSEGVDRKPQAGTTYYRVCAIAKQSDDNYRRYCSSVTKLGIADGQTTEQIKPISTDYKTSNVIAQKISSYTMSEDLKQRMDLIFENFLHKIDEKYSDDTEAKIDRLQTISEKLATAVAKTSSNKIQIIFNHILMKVEEQLALLSLEQILE